VNHEVLLYDPIHGRIATGDAGIAVEIMNKPGNRFDFGWGVAKIQRDSLVIDLKSMVSGVANKVSREKEGVFKLSAVTAKGNEQVAHIDRSKSCPYTRIEVNAPGQKEPTLELVIAADEPTPAFAWRFPSVQSYDQKVPAVKFLEWQNRRYIDATSSMLYRYAFGDSAYRQKWEQTYGKVDWQKAQTDDAKASAALRQIISDLRADK
jgi:hypothetical protein